MVNSNRNIILLSVALFVLCVFGVKSACALTPRQLRHRVLTSERAHERAEIRSENRYNYVKSHDYNNDGIIDNRDRLRWIREHGDTVTVLVSTENEDLAGVMDTNGNGTVEAEELRAF